MTVRRIAVTLPEGLFDMVKRPREDAHRSRSEVLQVAVGRCLGKQVSEPADEEQGLLVEALAEAERLHDAGLPWSEVRDGLLAE